MSFCMFNVLPLFWALENDFYRLFLFPLIEYFPAGSYIWFHIFYYLLVIYVNKQTKKKKSDDLLKKKKRLVFVLWNFEKLFRIFSCSVVFEAGILLTIKLFCKRKKSEREIKPLLLSSVTNTLVHFCYNFIICQVRLCFIVKSFYIWQVRLNRH